MGAGAVWMLGGLDYAAVTKNWWAATRLLWFTFGLGTLSITALVLVACQQHDRRLRAL